MKNQNNFAAAVKRSTRVVKLFDPTFSGFARTGNKHGACGKYKNEDGEANERFLVTGRRRALFDDVTDAVQPAEDDKRASLFRSRRFSTRRLGSPPNWLTYGGLPEAPIHFHDLRQTSRLGLSPRLAT